jgi:hypothetical protein
MVEMMAAATRSRKTCGRAVGIMLILGGGSVAACSTAPEGASVVKAAGVEEAHLRLGRVEEPAGDPGNVVGGAFTLQDQRTLLQGYRDALYGALTAALTEPHPAGDCTKCPVMTSRILAIDESMVGFPSKTDLTVLFSLTDPGRPDDPLWSKVIKKTGQSYNPVGVLRVRSAREEAVAEVLRELVTDLPSNIQPRS